MDLIRISLILSIIMSDTRGMVMEEGRDLIRISLILSIIMADTIGMVMEEGRDLIRISLILSIIMSDTRGMVMGGRDGLDSKFAYCKYNYGGH